MKGEMMWGMILMAVVAVLPACGKGAADRITGDTPNAGTVPSGLDPALVNAILQQVYGLSLYNSNSGGGGQAPRAVQAISSNVDSTSSFLGGTIRYSGTVSYSTPTADTYRYDYDYVYSQKDVQVTYNGTLYLISGSQNISATYTYSLNDDDYNGDQSYAGTFSVFLGDVRKTVGMDVRYKFSPDSYSWSGTVDGRAVSGSI